MIKVVRASRDGGMLGRDMEYYTLILGLSGDMGVTQAVSDRDLHYDLRPGPGTPDFMWREMTRRIAHEIEAEVVEAVIQHGLLPSSHSIKR